MTKNLENSTDKDQSLEIPPSPKKIFIIKKPTETISQKFEFTGTGID